MEYMARLVLAIIFTVAMYLIVNDNGRKNLCVTSCIISWCAYVLVTSLAFVGYAGFIYLLLQLGALFALVNCEPKGFAPYAKFYSLTLLSFILATSTPIESWFQLWISLTTVASIVAYKELKSLHLLMHNI